MTRRTTAGGDSSRRTSVVRTILIVFCVLAIVSSLGVLAFRFFTESGGGDVPRLLSKADALTSDPERLAEVSALLDKAEKSLRKQGGGVESELSVLKRRRVLARLKSPAYATAYLNSAVAAAERIPASEAAAAVVVDAALLAVSSDPKTAQLLKSYAVKLSGEGFGALKTLAFARALSLAAPTAEVPPSALLAASDAYASKNPRMAEKLAVDAAVSAVLSGDTLTARTIARDRLSDADALSPATVRFLAETAYDFGDRREAAAFFSRLPGEEAALRRADASFLAGDYDDARECWSASASGKSAAVALFNLSSSAPNREAALSYARRLYSSFPDFGPGVVLYSRLLDGPDGATLLSQAGKTAKDTRVELESVRLDSPRVGIQRTEARLWLLVNRDPRSETAARWAAWYMCSSGSYDEVSRLVRAYRASNEPESWTYFYDGLEAARAGRADEAEKAFERAAGSGSDWRLAANTAALYEARGNLPEALQRYQIAAGLRPSASDAAELHLREARALRSLGREGEARRALDYALSLDPANRRVRLEARR